MRNPGSRHQGIGEPLDWANRLPEVSPAAEVQVGAIRIKAEAPRAGAIVRVRNRQPIVAVRTGKTERSPVAAAGAGEEDAGGSVGALACDRPPFDTVPRRLIPVALAPEVVRFLFRRHTPFPAPVHVRRIMIRRKDTVRRDPFLALQGGNALVAGRHISIPKREARTRPVARDPTFTFAPISHRVAPPEVESVVLGVLRTDVCRGPIRPALPELDLGVSLDGHAYHDVAVEFRAKVRPGVPEQAVVAVGFHVPGVGLLPVPHGPEMRGVVNTRIHHLLHSKVESMVRPVDSGHCAGDVHEPVPRPPLPGLHVAHFSRPKRRCDGNRREHK